MDFQELFLKMTKATAYGLNALIILGIAGLVIWFLVSLGDYIMQMQESKTSQPQQPGLESVAN